MIYIGIDPGASGGIGILDGNAVGATIIKNATEREVYDRINGLINHGEHGKAIIEKVGAMPKQGLSSTFKFGQSYGSIRMALIAAGIPFDEVTPQRWQKELGLIRSNKNETITAKKNRHKAKAQQLFPHVKITHAIADALLIAEYCRRVS
jgi:crossover junction endodeoxyribonuclease RuvC